MNKGEENKTKVTKREIRLISSMILIFPEQYKVKELQELREEGKRLIERLEIALSKRVIFIKGEKNQEIIEQERDIMEADIRNSLIKLDRKDIKDISCLISERLK